MSICDALVKFEYKSPSNVDLAKHVGFTDAELQMLDMFWKPTFNKGWIYLSRQLILDMNYKQVSNFYSDTLRHNYTENIDYEEVDENHELVRFYDENLNGDKSPFRNIQHKRGKAQKYYIITGTTLKKMLMKCGTKKGDQICDYYLKVEQLAIFMKDYIVALHEHLMQKQLEQQTKLLEEKDSAINDQTKLIEEKDSIIKEKDSNLNRINIVNLELLTFKKLNERNESIYIVATYRYATQGVFKVGRTKCMKTRISGHNNTHIAGDKVKVLKEFKVNDSVAVENYIHRKLKGLLVHDEREFFLCPYDLLENIIQVMLSNDESHNNLINSVIDAVYQLKCSTGSFLQTSSFLQNEQNELSNKWMTGIDMSCFREEYQLILSGTDEPEIQAKFDMTMSTESQKKEFVAQCIQSYKDTIENPNQLIWKTFQTYLINQLQIPKYRFKSLHWKPMFNEANRELI